MEKKIYDKELWEKEGVLVPLKMNLTEKSKALFKAYAEDAGNWNGTPLVGGNVGGSQEDNGNLTHLKKLGLVETFEYGKEIWISFTDKGRALAKKMGIEIEIV